MSLSTDSSTPVDNRREFQISGTFEATGIDDALAFLADYFAAFADCAYCELNAETGAHERAPRCITVRRCDIDVRPTLIR